MWESPIDAIYDDVKTTFENEVLKSVQSVHIKVDRNELIKALAYDRNQYEKGYADGQRDAEKHGRWKGEGMGSYRCSLCGFIVSGNGYRFCPACGAMMKEPTQTQRSQRVGRVKVKPRRVR